MNGITLMITVRETMVLYYHVSWVELLLCISAFSAIFYGLVRWSKQQKDKQ